MSMKKLPDIATSPDDAGVSRASNYEIFIAFITVIAAIIVLLYLFLPTSEEIHEILFGIDFLVCAIFLFDFFRRLYKAPDKWRYLYTWGWVDLIGSVPWWPALRLLRIISVRQSFLSVRGLTIRQVLAQAKEDQAEVTLLVLVTVVVVSLSLGSVLILMLEGDSPEANITTSIDALWWAFVTVSTVGYGDQYPVTTEGRLIATIFIIVGISIFSVFTSYLTTRFSAFQNKTQAREIAEIRAQLDHIQMLLEEPRPPAQNEITDDESQT